MKVTQYKDTTEYLFETEKEKFLRYFQERQKDNNKVMAVLIKSPSLASEELIINLECNISSKLEYYENAYNDKLELKACNDIKIKAYSYTYMKNVSLGVK